MIGVLRLSSGTKTVVHVEMGNIMTMAKKIYRYAKNIYLFTLNVSEAVSTKSSHSHKSTTSARYNSSINGIYCVSFVDLQYEYRFGF